MRLPRPWFLALASVALCSACATQRAPTAQELQSLKKIDVVIEVPEKNFAAAGGSGTYYVTPGAGISLSAAIGIGLAANLITAGIEYVASTTFREAAVPVSATIDDIDLRRTVFNQLKSLLPAERSAAMSLSEGKMPKLEDGQT